MILGLLDEYVVDSEMRTDDTLIQGVVFAFCVDIVTERNLQQ